MQRQTPLRVDSVPARHLTCSSRRKRRPVRQYRNRLMLWLMYISKKLVVFSRKLRSRDCGATPLMPSNEWNVKRAVSASHVKDTVNSIVVTRDCQQHIIMRLFTWLYLDIWRQTTGESRTQMRPVAWLIYIDNASIQFWIQCASCCLGSRHSFEFAWNYCTTHWQPHDVMSSVFRIKKK